MPILELCAWFADNVFGKSLNQAANDGCRGVCRRC
jgi:hypothetical protein